ncbi:MAG: efflux RND transporter periplasmic adaptor subunit [Sphingobacteriales bacterium]|nr:efflux RND transporter periplasmic adaptor subunit [Sphingobacteriales bacterium]
MRNLLFLVTIALLLQSCGGKTSEKNVWTGKDTIPVKLIPIRSDTSVNQVDASGLLSTENEARLSFKTGGVIENVWVKEGDKVRAGQLLATLKSTEIAAQVQQVELGLEKAQRDYQRAYNLYRDSVATLEQLQNAKTGADIARQNLQQALFNQQYSKIYAPADGFIVKKLGNTGELASPGTPVLVMNAASASSKWILKLGLADHDWALVENGNKATVKIDAFPGKIFPAVVSKKSLAADPVSGSFQAELQVELGKEQAAIGMFGTATITASGSTPGFSIPYDALLEANGKKGFVFVTDDRRSVKKVEVTIVSISNTAAYISSGLEGHAFLVSSGSPYLNEQSVITAR